MRYISPKWRYKKIYLQNLKIYLHSWEIYISQNGDIYHVICFFCQRYIFFISPFSAFFGKNISFLEIYQIYLRITTKDISPLLFNFHEIYHLENILYLFSETIYLFEKKIYLDWRWLLATFHQVLNRTYHQSLYFLSSDPL